MNSRLDLPGIGILWFDKKRFEDRDRIFFIDYEKSVENMNNPKFLLMYVANLGLNCMIDKVTPELLENYMTMREATNIINLRYVHANVLYLAKYGDVLFPKLKKNIGARTDFLYLSIPPPHLCIIQLFLIRL